MNVQEWTSTSELSDLLQQGGPVVLDFHAAWCGPCKQAMPKLLELASQYPEVSFAKVDVDAADGEISQAFDVTSLPLFVLVSGGVELRRWRGYSATSTLQELSAALESVRAQRKLYA
jgi:thioredoxin 1